MARIAAELLALQMNELRQEIERYPDTYPLAGQSLVLDRHIRLTHLQYRAPPDMALALDYNVLAEGLGSGRLDFIVNARHDEALLRLGVTERHLLIVGLHHDAATQTQAEVLAARQPAVLGYFETRYFFDDGRFGKLSVFPRQIPDSRPAFGHLAPEVQVVQSEMTPSDFSLAGQALHALKETIRTYPPRSPLG